MRQALGALVYVLLVAAIAWAMVAAAVGLLPPERHVTTVECEHWGVGPWPTCPVEQP